MNTFYKLFFAFIFSAFVLYQNITSAQTNPEDPRFTMTVKNISTTNPGGSVRDSILRFEIWMQQINQGQPGVNDFEYCAGQFTWSYNRAIQRPGENLFLGLGPANTQTGGLPPALRPPSFQVDSVGGFLKMSGNLPNSLANFFISGIFPGTRIFTAQLRTSANRFQTVPLNLRFKLGESPNTYVAYFLPYPDTVDSESYPSQFAVALMDTINPDGGNGSPVYSVENGGFTPPPPGGTPVCNFYANTTTLYNGNSVNFTDSSLNTPTTWSWSFPGGTPSTSNVQNPSGIVYNTPGVYSVTLVVTNANGTDTKTRTNYITVLQSCLTIWKNTIKITDAGNVKDSLKLGTSALGTINIDTCLGEKALPPVPPSGAFDVRFLLPTEASKIDIRKDSAGDKVWTMQFQPSPSGYPITFTWDINSFPANEFFYLRDLVGGSVVNVNMLNQNSYTLTNSGITSLRIEYYNKINKSISLKSGWNILSMPLLKADMKVTSLFPTAASLAYSYTTGYVSVDSMKNGKGYWLRFNSDTTYNILGINVTPKNMNVVAGWNLIGPFDENIAVSSVISSPSGIITSSFYGFSNMYFITDTLKSGKGYWVKTSASGTLMKSTLDNITSVNSDSVSSWTKLTFTNSENSISELHLANANEITQNYDLPPVPPEGIFDVRFSSDKSTETYGKTHTIKINSSVLPVKIKVSNLKNHRIRLKDVVTGELFNVVLIEGVEVDLNQNLDNIVLIDEGIIPNDYSLSQNYPNPFNPSTTINYDVPQDASVRIVIYDLLGKEVQTLVNQFVKAGSYDVKFNAYNLSSGIYIYKMQSGSFSQIKRMVLLK